MKVLQLFAVAVCIGVAVARRSEGKVEADLVQGKGLCFKLTAFIDDLRETEEENELKVDMGDDLIEEVAEFCEDNEVKPAKCFVLAAHAFLIDRGLRIGKSSEEICGTLRNLPIFNNVSKYIVEDGIACTACSTIVGMVKFALKVMNKSESWIKERLENICAILPLQIQKDECGYILDKIDDVVKMILEGMNPGDVCKALEFCTNSTIETDGFNTTQPRRRHHHHRHRGHHGHHRHHGHHGHHRHHGHHGHHGHHHCHCNHTGNHTHHHRNHTCHNHTHGGHHHHHEHHRHHRHHEHHCHCNHSHHNHSRHGGWPMQGKSWLKKKMVHWFSNLKARISPVISGHVKVWKKFGHRKMKEDRMDRKMMGKGKLEAHIWSHLAGHGGLRVHSIDYRMRPCSSRQCVGKKIMMEKFFRGQLCHKCAIIGSMLKHQLHERNATREDLLEVMHAICERMPPRISIKMCGYRMQREEKFIDEIMKTKKVGEACRNLKLCDFMSDKRPGNKIEKKGKEFVCHMCQRVKGKLKSILDSEEVQLPNFNSVVQEICSSSEIENITDASRKCSMLSALTSKKKKILKAIFSPVPCWAAECPRTTISPEDEEKMIKMATNRKDKKACHMCQKHKKIIEFHLKMVNKSLYHISKEMKAMCNAITDEVKASKCFDVVGAMKISFEYIFSKLNPDNVCKESGLCTKEPRVQEKLKEKFLRKFNQAIAKETQKEPCQLCKISVDFIRQSAALSHGHDDAVSVIQEAYKNSSDPSQANIIARKSLRISLPRARKISAQRICEELRLCPRKPFKGIKKGMGKAGIEVSISGSKGKGEKRGKWRQKGDKKREKGERKKGGRRRGGEHKKNAESPDDSGDN